LPPAATIAGLVGPRLHLAVVVGEHLGRRRLRELGGVGRKALHRDRHAHRPSVEPIASISITCWNPLDELILDLGRPHHTARRDPLSDDVSYGLPASAAASIAR
jgi:hypothetical protein